MIERVNPPTLYQSPVFSQGTIAPAGRTLFVGGQNGVDSDGVMASGMAAQVKQAIANVQAVLAAGGATPDDVAKLTIYLDQRVDPREAYAASVDAWGEHRCAVTAMLVAGLAVPGALVEIEAVAALPE
ncbi:Endoribonuclease L-PSP [Xylanimonas cellulosilytica DSM 15894]|uniref:Endoribonuclease L-PSP n=1 Tax=Xylanimonas cellulosilytica (strain DSM 15894 / JCM 12276 / CECT 5975 / KCTC 9989 / LMG 20990 / NBRC 107835 / XIL07) TaxID=446471 RepID=D1BRN1_XYLCX|nr:RidA family protein [Xylanimonas cellulosilytica]ACZ32297.1 Endoribonuclease L-PSP [Xylanimonas cellulosilytica DSM 15894]